MITISNSYFAWNIFLLELVFLRACLIFVFIILFVLPVNIAFCIGLWNKSNKSPLPLLFVATNVYYKEQKSVF